MGEFVTSGNISASQTSRSTNNLTSISLTAEDWDVDGAIQYVCSVPTLTDAYTCVSTTSLDTSQSNMVTTPCPAHHNGGECQSGGVTSPRLRSAPLGYDLVVTAGGPAPDPIPNSAVKTLCADRIAVPAAVA